MVSWIPLFFSFPNDDIVDDDVIYQRAHIYSSLKIGTRLYHCIKL